MLLSTVLTTSLIAGGCGSSPSAPSTPNPLLGYVTDAVPASGVRATARSGAPQSNGGPIVTVAASATVINGGSLVARLTATTPFQTVFIQIGGVDGYWVLSLPSAVTDTFVLITLSTQLPQASFDLVYYGVSVTGSVGPPASTRAVVNQAAATGVVQVSASWDALSDVDLHVVEPSGEEVYYGHRSSGTSGQLDLDSNAACRLDSINNENIRWIGTAPAGNYTVRLDYFDSCGVPATNWVVTVNNGGTTRVFTGAFTGSGDGGARGAGQLVATFAKTGSSLSTAVRTLQPPALLPDALSKLNGREP